MIYSVKFSGIADQTAMFLQKEQLLDVTLWRRFVDQYRIQDDSDNQGWRGEFWGKMMRAGALVYSYTKDETLLSVLTDSVKDILTVMEEDGRVSTYKREKEFDSWDLWCRKYVMLGLEYYLDICNDAALRQKVIAFLCRMADYIVAHIGKEQGKKSITDASRSWAGINSSSILEPFVRLYSLTNNPKYLDFSTYIIENGGAKGINVFELAYENKLLPYQYGVSKAYELTSCFEGLLAYYRVTGIEKYKTAVINYAYAVLNSECSVIGSCGITHELFDHTAWRQTVFYDGVMQETCVTVTWMKFCAELLALTGDTAFADAIETSFYNAYLGSINTEYKNCPYIYEKYVEKLGFDHVVPVYLPFDSYSPLTPDRRGKKVGGNQLMADYTYYGCCACIGSAGIGVFLRDAVCVDGDTVTVNFFEKGELSFFVDSVPVTIKITTDYPISGDIALEVRAERPVKFILKVRIPAWAGTEGYRLYDRTWQCDTVSLSFPMNIRFIHPVSWEKDVVYTDMSHSTAVSHIAVAMQVEHKPEDDRFVALMRGPLVLAADERLGKSVRSTFSFASEGQLAEDVSMLGETRPLLKLFFRDKGGESFALVDYASAGKDWKSEIAAWLPIE